MATLTPPPRRPLSRRFPSGPVRLMSYNARLCHARMKAIFIPRTGGADPSGAAGGRDIKNVIGQSAHLQGGRQSICGQGPPRRLNARNDSRTAPHSRPAAAARATLRSGGDQIICRTRTGGPGAASTCQGSALAVSAPVVTAWLRHTAASRNHAGGVATSSRLWESFGRAVKRKKRSAPGRKPRRVPLKGKPI
jgi:hypothetical protein